MGSGCEHIVPEGRVTGYGLLANGQFRVDQFDGGQCDDAFIAPRAVTGIGNCRSQPNLSTILRAGSRL